MTKAPNDNWWRGGVIYQIYPRSYADSNGDGIGDLPGITTRLDYVARLGVDAIWLSPFFKSPMKDFGYDVSDYRAVDSMFGTLEDFKALLLRAHELGLKVMIDQVLSHTSDQHPWFVESRSSKDNPKADWYVWADAQEDGTPPNNWLSAFGDRSAWQWDTRRCQYYMHNFLTSQPDLNFHNPDVQQAVLDSVKFWLDLGVDGYRLDTSNYYFHDIQLRSNPGKGGPSHDPAVHAANPYGWQRHLYDKSQPENLLFLRMLRALLDQYANTTMVGEITEDDALARLAEYTNGGDKLHMAYCFDLFGVAHSATYLHGVLSRFEEIVDSGWPSWALSNHDVTRVASRWGGDKPEPSLLRVVAAMQMSLRGSPCIYQGDELGLPEAEIAFEDLKDPYGIGMWPEYKGRDGCRTPFPWTSNAVDLGFSPDAAKANAPWLPVAESHRALAVDVQEAEPSSLLNFYRNLLQWRKTQPALVVGEMTVLAPDEQVLAYVRSCPTQRILCVFNFSENAATWQIPEAYVISSVLSGSGLMGAHLDGMQIQLEPWSGLFAVLN